MSDLTFLFTDVVGSTKRWEADAEGMADALAEHDAAIAAAVGAHGGRLLKTKGEGDSTVSVFERPADALAAAAHAQRAVAMPVRMAVHTGPVEARDGDYFGRTLNRAARLRAIAHGGQVICSEATASAADVLGDGLDLVGVGVHRLKDLTAPERVFQLVGDGLAADFPPLLSLNRSTSNLPARQSSFIGRIEELAHVRSLVERSRLVTLTGTGGSGKTRLSLEVAGDLLDAFPDGVWFCELAPISDDAAVGNVVATAANISLLPGDPSQQVVAALADKTVLVVLDNCEHVIEGAARFAADLLTGAPEVRVIATSRERLRLTGEAAWTVPPLGLPRDDATPADSEAVQLFLDRTSLAAPGLVVDGDELEAIVAICRRVEAVPLAIELAAARVRMMNVHDLRARLEQHWDILSGGDRNALPHQRSLRATIDWSHSLLSPSVQEVLHRLAVFRGGFELSSAERVLVATGMSGQEALDAVQDLVDKSLVELDRSTGRYRILETVRAYALEQLDADLAGATRRAHAAHFVDVLREVEDRILRVDRQREALLLVALEHDNIVAALTWALEHDHTIAGQLVGYSFGPWYGLGQPEAPMWYRRLLPFIDELDGEPAMRACNALGMILGYLGDKDIAFPLLDRAVAIARTTDDVEMLAMALSLSASMRHAHQELEAALPMTREAMAIPITSERQMLRAWVCSLSSWVFWSTGSKDAAHDAIIESHELCLEHDDHVIRSSLLDPISVMAPDYMTAEQASAERLVEHHWLHQAGATEGAATRTDRWAFLRNGPWDVALEHVEHLLTLPQTHWREEFDRRLKKSALLQLLGRREEAAALGEQLVTEARHSIDRHRALCHLAIARRDIGDLAGSEAACAEATQYLLDGHNPTGGWHVDPTSSLAGWMLLLQATVLIESAEGVATVARVVGAAYGLLDQDDVDFDFELACVRHGYEDRLPAPDPVARSFAAVASLAKVLGFLTADPRLRKLNDDGGL